MADSGLGGFHFRGCLETKINVFFTQRNVFQENKELKLCFESLCILTLFCAVLGMDGD